MKSSFWKKIEFENNIFFKEIYCSETAQTLSGNSLWFLFAYINCNKSSTEGISSYHNMSNLRVGETRLAGIADEVGIAWMNQSLRVLMLSKCIFSL